MLYLLFEVKILNIIIVYATKTGCTSVCASELSGCLKFQDVKIYNKDESEPDLSRCDICIVGGSIRFGKLDKRIYNFIQKNRVNLDKCKTAYYICNAFDEETDRYFSKCFPKGVIDKALAYSSFGGELKIDKQKGIDKLVVKMILKENEENDDFSMPNIQTDAINRFADELKKHIKNEG